MEVWKLRVISKIKLRFRYKLFEKKKEGAGE
jgi:hypothetical protein